jgi:predicted nucleotidyltransferase
MKSRRESYRQSRDELLEKIVTELAKDERFVAGWLTGSYARNEADEFSDLDLSVVVAEPHSELLCKRPKQVSQETTSERFTLFSRFGEPALIHENNNNAPEGGTFTFVLYARSALMVDWTLVPQERATRPLSSLLLFDRVNIPVVLSPAAEGIEKRKEAVAEQWAFFWMVAAITIKYILRQDEVFVNEWLENLHRILIECEWRISGEPLKYTRGSLNQLQPTPKKQIESIRFLCERMQALAPGIVHFCGQPLALPVEEIESLLALANEKYARD